MVTGYMSSKMELKSALKSKMRKRQQVESKNGKFASHRNGRFEERSTEEEENVYSAVKEVKVVGGPFSRE